MISAMMQPITPAPADARIVPVLPSSVMYKTSGGGLNGGGLG